MDICPYSYEERINGSTFEYIMCKLSKDKQYPICGYSRMCIQCGHVKMKPNWDKKCFIKRKADNGELIVDNKN